MKKIILSAGLALSLFGLAGLNANAAEVNSLGETKASLAITYDTNTNLVNDVKLRFGGVIKNYTDGAEYGVITLDANAKGELENGVDSLELQNYIDNRNAFIGTPEQNSNGEYQIARVIPNVEGHFNHKFVSALYKKLGDKIDLGTLKTASVMNVVDTYLADATAIPTQIKGVLSFLESNYEYYEDANDTLGWVAKKGVISKDPSYNRFEGTFVNNESVLEKKIHLLNSRNIEVYVQPDNATNEEYTYKLDLVLGDKAYNLYTHKNGIGAPKYAVNLDKVTSLKGVSFENQDATFRLTTTRIGGLKDSKVRFWHFKLTYKESCDFGVNGAGGDTKKTDGFTKVGAQGILIRDPNWARIQLEHKKGESIEIQKKYFIPDNNVTLVMDLDGLNANNGSFDVIMNVDGKDYTIYNTPVAKGRNAVSLDLDKLAQLKGVDYSCKEVTFRIKSSKGPNDTNMVWIWDFAIQQNHN